MSVTSTATIVLDGGGTPDASSSSLCAIIAEDDCKSGGKGE